jgi:cation:H+ antiporter
MTAVILQFLASAAVIVIAGSLLTRWADAIAHLTGLGRMLVGMVLVAGVTSLPELAVDLSAVRMGAPDLAVGDLLGSSLMNLLILGVLDLVHRSHARMLSPASAAHALSGAMSISLTALAGVAVVVGPRTAGLAVGGVGIVPWAMLVVFLLGVRLVFYDQKLAKQKVEASTAAVGVPAGSLRNAVIGFAVAAAVIVVAGPFLARSANRLAELSGLGGTFVGTTLVALSTSLPELVTSSAALRLRAFDLIVGNILGSNAFNMALFAPLDLFYPGSLFGSVSPTHALTAFAVIVVTSVVIAGQLYHVERRRHFIEPDAALVIALVLASLAMIYLLR